MNINKKRVIPYFLSFCMAMMLAPASTAATVVFDFSKSADTGFPDTQVARLSIADVAGGATEWTLSADWDIASSSAFIHFLSYDYHGAGAFTPSSYSVFTGAVAEPVFREGPNHSKLVSFQTKNDSGRFTTGESVTWRFENSNVNDFSLNYAKVNAINDGNSVRFAPVSPVPEPATYAMMVLGLAGLSLIRRRTNT